MKDLVLSLCFCTSWPYKPGKDLRLAWHGDGNIGRQMIWADQDEIWGISRMSLNLTWSVISWRIFRYYTSTTNVFFIWRLVNYINFLHNLQILWKCLVESCLVHFRAISLLKCMGWNLMMTWWHYNSPIIGLTCLHQTLLLSVGKFGRSKFLTTHKWIQMAYGKGRRERTSLTLWFDMVYCLKMPAGYHNWYWISSF